MRHVIAIISGKGGAGKTATTVNLAWTLACDYGYKSVIVDIDKDKPDALGWNEQAEASGHTSFKVDTFLCETSPKELISDLQEKFDFVIIDTPPNFQGDAFKATLISDFVIIPSSPSLSDQKVFIKSMEIAEECGKPFQLLAVRTQKRHNLSQDLVNSIEEMQGFKTNISLRSCVMEAQFHGCWVGEYQPNSDSHLEFKKLAAEVIDYVS